MSLNIVVFMTMSNVYDEFFCENNLSLKAAIFAKIPITDVLRRSKYACMNDTRKKQTKYSCLLHKYGGGESYDV